MGEIKNSKLQLIDTQSLPDNRQIPVDRVGIKNLNYPILVRDKYHQEQSSIANVQMTVDLPHHFKGTHMSRFIEVIHSHGNIIHVSSIPHILHELCHRFESNSAHIDFKFPYFIEKKAPITGAAGLVDYSVNFSSTLTQEKSHKIDFILTVVVPVTTLCPCSKSISNSGAHNQRGHVTYSVRFIKPMWIEDMIRLVELSASCELYSLLKRPDEKFVTDHAYDNPVFVEDLVRNVAEKSNLDNNIIWYRVEAENFESIHNHNAYASIEVKK